MEFSTIVAAKQEAAVRANRDGCIWRVWTRNLGKNFIILHEFQKHPNNNLFQDVIVSTHKPDQTSVTLTKAEAELVEYILRDDAGTISEAANSPEVRKSLWKKMKKYLEEL